MANTIAWTEAWERAVQLAWVDSNYRSDLLSGDIVRVRAAMERVGYTLYPDVKMLTFVETGKELNANADGEDQFQVFAPLPEKPASDPQRIFDSMKRRDPDFLC